MLNYLQLLQDIYEHGVDTSNRTGIQTRSLIFKNLSWDLSKGFPLITTKKLHIKSILYELLWFLKGSTNIKFLTDNGIRIWNEWADADGDLGPIYGKQWVSWESIQKRNNGLNINTTPTNQIEWLINEILVNPDSRRLLVSAWNVSDLNKMALPPCHYAWQVIVRNNKINLHWNQRSADCFLGLPYNIASYAFLTHMIAQVTQYQIGVLSVSIGDAHIYHNHFEQIAEQLKRTPHSLPTLEVNSEISDIFKFTYKDFTIKNYNADPHIAGKVAV